MKPIIIVEEKYNHNPDFAQVAPWILFVGIAFLVNCTSRVIIAPMINSIQADFTVSYSTATSIQLFMSFGYVLGMFASGFLMSRFQPRTIIAFSLILSGTAFNTCLFVESINDLRLAILFVGLTAGMYFPAGMNTIHGLVNIKDWGKAIGIHEFAPNLAFILAPLLANFLLAHVEWRQAVAISGTFSVITGSLFLLFGKGGRSYNPAPSFNGIMELVKMRQSWAFMLLLAIGITGEFAIYNVAPLFLKNTIGFTPETANTILAYSRIGTLFSVVIGGFVADKVAPNKIITVCFIIFSATLMCFYFHNKILVVAAFTLQASSIAFIFPSVFRILAITFPASKQAVVLSVFMPMGSFIAGGIMPNLLGLAGDTIGFSLGFVILGVVCLFSPFLLCFFPNQPVTNE